jgi:hypothetical protein
MEGCDPGMRSSNVPLREMSIKVPGPFAGIADLGFTAQYRAQDRHEPLRDVPLLIEGPRPPMIRLAAMLQLLRDAAGTSHAWTDPIMLSDEVVLLAFRDRSLAQGAAGFLSDGAPAAASDYVLNLIRPVVFTFLHDCAVIAHLRLSEVIEMRVTADRETIAAMTLPLGDIVPSNGDRLLWQLAG